MSEAAVPADVLAGGRIGASLSTDDRLARRAAAGDERAFAAIFRRYHQDLYRYCLAILRNPDDAQDALQGTMVKAMQALPGERRQIELKPWLYRVAHNESIDLVRRRRASEPLPAELAAPGPGLAREAEARQRLGALLADLETLPERQRGALVMRELSGLEFAEIGTALGTSAAVARQTVYEARLSLRQIETGREMDCDAVTKALSAADGRVTRRRDIRAHLRACPDCRKFGEEIGARSRDLAALSPLPALAAGGLLQGIFGSQGASSGLGGALGGGGAKALGTSAALKATATIAVVAVVGAGAAQRADLIHVGLPGNDPAPSSRSEPGAASESAAPRTSVSPTQQGPSAADEHPRASDLGTARAALPAATGARRAQEHDPADPAATQSPSATSTHGRGHGGQPSLPEAASHGQQTAAAHKNTTQGGKSGARGSKTKTTRPVKPPKPAHPTPPAKPTKSPPPSPPPSPHAAKPDQPSGAAEPASPES